MLTTPSHRAPLPRRRPESPWGHLCLVGLFVMSFMSSTALGAASLEVSGAAAHRGSDGLRITVGSSCASPQDQVVENQTLTGPTTIEGWQTVTSSSTTISSGEVTFSAGERIVPGDGFVVQSGVTLRAVACGSLRSLLLLVRPSGGLWGIRCHR
jgi:hypothetical protein